MVTFLEAPLRSRTVGFPESGSDLGCIPEAFPTRMKLKCWHMYTPLRIGLPSDLVPNLRAKALRLSVRTLLRTAKCPEPLCRRLVLPSIAASPACCRKALPLLHRSYRLMRQTKTLPRPRFVGLYPGSLQVLPVPAGSWPFPTLVLQSVLRRLDPYPAASVRCIYPFLPGQLRPHLTRDRFGTRKDPLHYNFSQGSAFRGCSHSLMFRLLNLLDLQVVPTAGRCQGSQAFYTTQDLSRYRTQVVASLHTRLGQLVRRDLHPLDCIVVGCYPSRLRFGFPSVGE